MLNGGAGSYYYMLLITTKLADSEARTRRPPVVVGLGSGPPSAGARPARLATVSVARTGLLRPRAAANTSTKSPGPPGPSARRAIMMRRTARTSDRGCHIVTSAGIAVLVPQIA